MSRSYCLTILGIFALGLIAGRFASQQEAASHPESAARLDRDVISAGLPPGPAAESQLAIATDQAVMATDQLAAAVAEEPSAPSETPSLDPAAIELAQIMKRVGNRAVSGTIFENGQATDDRSGEYAVEDAQRVAQVIAENNTAPVELEFCVPPGVCDGLPRAPVPTTCLGEISDAQAYPFGPNRPLPPGMRPIAQPMVPGVVAMGEGGWSTYPVMVPDAVDPNEPSVRKNRLRVSSRQIDDAAALLEDMEEFAHADELRAIAQSLRQLARKPREETSAEATYAPDKMMITVRPRMIIEEVEEELLGLNPPAAQSVEGQASASDESAEPATGTAATGEVENTAPLVE